MIDENKFNNKVLDLCEELSRTNKCYKARKLKIIFTYYFFSYQYIFSCRLDFFTL